MARVVFTHIFFGLCGRGKEVKAGQRGAVKRCRPYGVCPFTRAMGHSYAVGSSLQYLCKEYLKAVVHQEFSDIDSDSGTYSDANGIKKAPAIATPARQTRGFCKAVACAPFLVGVCP